MPTVISYRSYAKVNLFLDVLRRRRDGYHNIETIFQTVGLADELYFTEQASRIALWCSDPDLDVSDANLVYRAALLLKERTGCAKGVRIQLEKHIPLSAGLAGGSGNAAATLIALNHLWELRLTDGQIRALALELGSDVPYCTVGGTVAAWGRGERLRPLLPLKETWFVLVHPDISVSASRAYNSPLLEFAEERPFAGWTRSFRRAVHLVEHGHWAQAVFNRMEGPVFAGHPNLVAAKHRLLEEGCVAAAMSGSGSTVFGICAGQREALGIAQAFDEYRTSVVSSVPRAVERI